MAAPAIPAAVPADVVPNVQGYTALIYVLITLAAVLAVALVWSLWLLWSRLRRRHAWEVAYWHLLATAQCPLCGSRMEGAPEQAPTGAVQLPQTWGRSR